MSPIVTSPLDDLVLADGALAVLDQHDQEIEDLRLDGQEAAFVANLVRLGSIKYAPIR